MNFVYNILRSDGSEEIMLNKSTMDIPLPTPLSVILSPIHIRKALPAVIVHTTTTTLLKPYFISRPCVPKPTAMAIACNKARPTVR